MISIFNSLPSVSGEYICARHGIRVTEAVEFNANEDGEHDAPFWYDWSGHMNGGVTQYHNLSQKTIEHRATYNRVTHWMDKPEVPMQLSTHEFYVKLKG